MKTRILPIFHTFPKRSFIASVFTIFSFLCCAWRRASPPCVDRCLVAIHIQSRHHKTPRLLSSHFHTLSKLETPNLQLNIWLARKTMGRTKEYPLCLKPEAKAICAKCDGLSGAFEERLGKARKQTNTSYKAYRPKTVNRVRRRVNCDACEGECPKGQTRDRHKTVERAEKIR